MKSLLLLLLATLSLTPSVGRAAPPPPPLKAPAKLTCAVCGKGPLSGKVWMWKTNAICAECYQIDSRCTICGLPVKDGFAKTSDGRFICKTDTPGTVLNLEQARPIFDETVAALRQMAGGALVLKNPKINLSVFDVDYWNVVNGKTVPNEMRRTGFSQSRHAGAGFVHNVLLLSGQPRAELAAVSAHEYAHLWINENQASAREMESETLEAVCELFAYKLLAARNDTAGMERIRTNPYTKGRIGILLAADASMGFNGVLDWVKFGTDRTLSLNRTENSAPAAIRPTSPPLPAPTLPTQLQLNGLIGGRRPQAIVNGISFEKGDERKVKLADKTVVVKCLDFPDRGVVLRVDNATNTITLQMDGR